jgi:hypothetical protein
MTTTGTNLPLPQQRAFGKTNRTDRWWLKPLLIFLGFGAFVVYSTWAAFQGTNYFYGVGGADYLSPFYSPLLFGVAEAHPLISVVPEGGRPPWWPGWMPFSTAFFILWAPGGFRFTCYYYRGAYYKAFWLDPVNCGVGEPRKGYRGEQKLPLILQNIHRYFLYVALIFIVILLWDAMKAFWFIDPEGIGHFGIGLGSIIMLCNAVFLGCYTCGCHSLRHLIGGRKDCGTCSGPSGKAYSCVSGLNSKHMMWAWISLFWVGFTDFYIRMCAAGIWSDPRFF